MKPVHSSAWCRALLGVSATACLLGAAGCTTPIWRSQSPDEETPPPVEEPNWRSVGDLSRVWGLDFVKLEAVALVSGLNSTGSDPGVSPQRDVLVRDMRVRGVRSPNETLARPDTSMVLVRAFLPPGVQKGDRVDIEVQVPSRSETTSLEDGWLMKTAMRELAVMDSQIHSGHILCLGQGPVVVTSLMEGEDDKVLKTRGQVLGGGIATESRSLGLFVRERYRSVRTSAMIGAAVNRRFHIFDRGVKVGVATPKKDHYVELKIHPRYNNNVVRYSQVVQAIAVKETSTERIERIARLEQEIFDPVTARGAALALEAMGAEGARILLAGLEAEDPEARFYAAEALAYLNKPEAAPVLAEAAMTESAFRWHALAALSVMDDLKGHDVLSDLLHVVSAETRYGAFRSLRAMNPKDPLVGGKDMGGEFALHSIATNGPPLIHFTRTRRAEMVMFGADQQFECPFVVFAGREIMVKGTADGQVRVSRFSPGQEDRFVTCTNRVDDVVRAVVKLDGSYCDVVKAVQKANAEDRLAGRVVFDALPRPGRTYHRDGGDLVVGTGHLRESQPDSPVPSMFLSHDDRSPTERKTPTKKSTQKQEEPEETTQTNARGFDRIRGWFAG